MASSRVTQIGNHLGLRNSQIPDPHPAEPYTVVEQPLGTAKKVRIITIGSGASGLNMIRTFRQKLTNFEHIVYEKNPEVGGTWYENRYPGCKCDIPSHNYQFSWKPNKEWSNFLSPAEEIQAYLCRLCDDEDLRRQIKTNHLVTGALWDEGAGRWTVRVKNLEDDVEFEDYCEFLLNASGILKYENAPSILIKFGLGILANHAKLATATGSGLISPVCTTFLVPSFIAPTGMRILTGKGKG